MIVVPAIVVPVGFFSVSWAWVTASLKVAVTVVVTGTPVVWAAGVTEETVGGMVSGLGVPEPMGVFMSAWISAAVWARL